MKILDPGHDYLVDSYDGGMSEHITFMKREGKKYPGNEGHYPGTNLQEVLRVLIDRIKYLDTQVECEENKINLFHLRQCLIALEIRAAARHGINVSLPKFWKPDESYPELIPACRICGHFLSSNIHGGHLHV